MKLPLYKKTKAEKKIRNLCFKSYHFGPLKKCIFGFWRKATPTRFSVCFGFDSALETIYAQLSFCKCTKKAISRQTCHFDHFCRAGNLLIAHLLICSFCSNQMSNCERFPQITQDKWVIVSESLRSLMTNERLWAICLGCS